MILGNGQSQTGIKNNQREASFAVIKLNKINILFNYIDRIELHQLKR